ncbi:HAD hydrolase-like protein [Phocaeicola plebeius]|nr:HAD hydrolase-like protein [Phocaeicola plebeius]
MVGDRKFDVSGAHAIGMECVGVLYGYGSEAELSSVHADRLVSSVTELTYELLAKV